MSGEDDPLVFPEAVTPPGELAERLQGLVYARDEQHRVRTDDRIGIGRQLEFAVDPGTDDVRAGLLSDTGLADSHAVERTPAFDGHLCQFDIFAEFDGVAQVRAERGEDLLSQAVAEDAVGREHAVGTRLVEDVFEATVVGECDDVDVGPDRPDRQDRVDVGLAGVGDDRAGAVDAGPLVGLGVLWRAVDRRVPVV